MLRIERFVEEHFIFLLDFVSRMTQPLGERAIVGEQKQSLAVFVQPANIVKASKMGRDQVEDRFAVSFIGPSAQETLRLMKKKAHSC